MVESGTLTCAKHPKEETYLRCGSCNKPICPKCACETPVGFKCRDCGTFQNLTWYKPTFWQVLIAIGIGLLAGAIGTRIIGSIGFFGIWIALLYGRFVGTVILRATGRKMGRLMDVITCGSIILGGICSSGLASFLLYMFATKAHGPATQLMHLPLSSFWALFLHPYTIIVAVIIGAAAISRLQYSRNYWGF